MQIRNVAVNAADQTVTMDARCKAFDGHDVETVSILTDVTPDGDVVATRVYDDIAGHYTTRHSLTSWHIDRIYAVAKRGYQEHC